MTATRQARPITFDQPDALRFLPEGPYSLRESVISWVAIAHGSQASEGSLNILDLARGSNQSFLLPGRPGFAFPCRTEGKFVIGCERSLGLFDSSRGAWEPFCEGIDEDVTGTIINDGMVFEDNLIFGTKDLQFATKKAGLYLYRGQDQQLIRLRADQICSNGKAIRRDADDGLELVDIDSPTRQIVSYAIDIEAGTLSEGEVLLDLTSDPAVPDGAIITPDDKHIIVSMFLPQAAEYGETRMYDLATGELKCVWQTPGSPQNTCPALVRHEGKIQLLITTAVENMTADDQKMCPNAGRLFIAEIEIDDPPNLLAPVFPA